MQRCERSNEWANWIKNWAMHIATGYILVVVLLENWFNLRFFFFIIAVTADCHYLRKFSFTSSQANKAFTLAFPAYKLTNLGLK